VDTRSESLWPRVAELPLVVAACEYERLNALVAFDFNRVTTRVRLAGAGTDGLGEDVSVFEEDGTSLHEVRPSLGLEGEWTLASFCEHLATVDPWPEPPEWPPLRRCRNWAFESAALDLALKQAKLSTGEALGRTYEPVNFVSSTRATSLDDWLELYPELRFKLDPTPEWTDEMVAGLAARGNVDVIDLKGQYEGTIVDNPADPDLYRRVVEAFPDAWIEDPKLTPETDAVLEPHRDRITWDAPIHSWADVEALPFAPKCLNVKPSRFGTLGKLFEFYERCQAEGIALYGGGQFELGPGRGQIQLLASLFSSAGSNDVAPTGYNDAVPRTGLETSPLAPLPERYGFRRGVPS
jgi:hypothetical protein